MNDPHDLDAPTGTPTPTLTALSALVHGASGLRRCALRACRTFALLVLAVASALLAGCASSLSSMQPATVVPRHQIHAVSAIDVSLPVSASARLVDQGQDIARKELRGETLTTNDRDRLLDASVALMLNAPTIGPDLQIGYGVFERTEVDFRYALSSLRLGARYQFFGPTNGHGWAGTVGLGGSHYSEAIPVPDFLDKIVETRDFVRNEVDVPLVFGYSSDLFHVWFGPKLVYSRFGSSLSVCTRFDEGARTCTQRAGADVNGSAWFAATQVGAAIGWKRVWFAAELTVARFSASADGAVTDGTETFSRHFAPTDVVIYPAFGLIGRF